MAGFFTSLFGGSRRRQPANRQRTALNPTGTTAAPRTDSRRPTANAEPTGRKAIPRPDPNLTPTPVVPPIPGLIPDPIAAAHAAAARQRKKGRTSRASALLGNSGSGAAAPVLSKRTLIGS